MTRCTFVALVAILGGCSPFVSVSGQVYGTDHDALLNALRDSGSTNLQCPAEQVRVRVLSSGRGSIYLAEGCAQRAIYAMDCAPHAVNPTSRPCVQQPPETPDCRRFETNACQLVLTSRLALD
jgi:hypothetical protein